MKKWIIYFDPDEKGKKLQFGNFSTEAKDMWKAIENLNKKATFSFRVLGVGSHNGIGFVNNLFQ